MHLQVNASLMASLKMIHKYTILTQNQAMPENLRFAHVLFSG